MRKVYLTAVGRLHAALDGSGLAPDPQLSGRLSGRAPVRPLDGEARLHALARQAAELALLQAPHLGRLAPDTKAVFVSSSKGGMEVFDGPRVDPGPGLWRYLSSSPGQALRQSLGWCGGGRNTPLACATGAYSLGLAFESIRSGRLEAALAGAVEASLTPLIVAAFDHLGVLDDQGPAAARRGPFDRFSRGFVLGEGGAVLVLESEDALARTGHRPLAEFSGWACTSDAYHLTAPEPEGRQAARCLRLALEQAGLAPADLAYVNAHGTGTMAGDRAEARALDAVFHGQRALRVSSIKGATGHTLGAAGALEAAVTVEALAGAPLPANVGCRDAMEGMEGWLLRSPEAIRGRHALSLSMGFGGHNVALAFSTVGGMA